MYVIPPLILFCILWIVCGKHFEVYLETQITGHLNK